MATTNEDTPARKKTNKLVGLISVLIGVIMVICGMLSATGDKNADNSLISGGTTQVCLSLLQEYDNADRTMNTIVYALEAAEAARVNESPEKLNEFINSHFDSFALQQTSTLAVVQAVMTYVNSAYKKSATEDEYWEKIHAISSGIRAAVNSFYSAETH